MNGNSTRNLKVEAGGTGVVAHVGLHAVGAFADTIGLGDALSSAIVYRGRGIPVHDRGKVLVHTAMTARSNTGVTAAISDSIGVDAWTPALDRGGEPRKDGAAVCELTSQINARNCRLIVRREPLHPGAQRSLFPSLEYRFWGFYTDQPGDPVDLDATMRAHAHVEQHIARLKDSGLCRFPFTRFDSNQAWLQTVTLAADLVRWFQLVCLPDSWRDARPKRLRWTLLHAPGRLIRTGRQTIVRVIDGWPGADVIVGAYQAIALLA